jgi:glutamine synthetase adenylyltransferase
MVDDPWIVQAVFLAAGADPAKLARWMGENRVGGPLGRTDGVSRPIATILRRPSTDARDDANSTEEVRVLDDGG